MSFFNVGKFSLTNTDASSVVLTVPDSNLNPYTFTFPDNSGTSGYVLQTDGSGVTSWVAQSSVPAGVSNSQVLFLDNGDISGNNNLTFTGLTSDLSLQGTFTVTGHIDTTDISSSGSAYVGLNLDVAGDFEADGDVSGATANFGTIATTSTITAGGNVDVTGNIEAFGTLDVTGHTALVDVSATNVEASGDVSGATANFGTIATTSTITAGGNVDVTGNVEASGDVSGATANFATSVTTKANIMTPNVISLYTGTINLDVSASVNIINYSSALDATATFNGTNNGQISHIFYNNLTGGQLQIDFGANKLVSGSGTNRYLTFNSPGQSASVVYSSDVDKYFIINTGALVS